GEGPRVAPVAVEDLLLRASVRIDYRRLETFVKGTAIVVTGGGGSIGAEICDRVVTFGAARLLIIENSEPALHEALESFAAKNGHAQIEGRIADVRDRARMFRLIADFKPDMVFHAAALKHVPLLERDWAAARAGRGGGGKDQGVGLGQGGGRGGRGGRARGGDVSARKGDGAGVGTGRDQALRRNVLPGARCRRGPARRRRARADAADRGA